MGEVFKIIVDFFTNKALHLGFRVSLFIVVVLGAFLINDYYGFSRHYVLNSKLDQLIKLKQIDSNVLKDDSAVKQKYLITKREILNDRSYIERVFTNTNSVSIHTYSKETIPNEQPSNLKSSRSIWLNLSSMGFFYLLIIIFISVLVSSLFDNKTAKEKFRIFIGVLAASIVFSLIGLLYKFFVSLIPLIPNFEWVSYIVYFLFPTTIAIYLAFRFTKEGRKTTSSTTTHH